MALFIKGDKALGEYLGIKSPKTLKKLRQNGLPYRINKLIPSQYMYNIAEVKEWMMENTPKGA